VEDDPRLDATWRLVTGWKSDALMERMPLVPRSVVGRLRATVETLPLLGVPRPEVIWTSAGTDLAPLAWSLLGPLRRPLVLDLDWTLDQRELAAPFYFGRPARTGVVATLNRARERAVWDRVKLFTPWSRWAADALRNRGVEDARIRILPPGVDLDRWQPAPQGPRPSGTAKLRLLFVGGDFQRKGGDLLLAVMRGPLGEHCHLDIVTRDAVPPTPGVTVHRLEPNAPALLELYRHADLFVMPSLAECFGIATIEAMATGLPALVSNRGASGEIVEHGRSGWLIEPTEQDLHDRLSAILDDRGCLPVMGGLARTTAVARYDGRCNDRQVADIVCGLSDDFLTSAARR